MPKKKYSINWENDEPSSFEVDGVSYESLEQVPDEGDRSKLEAMMNASIDQEFDRNFEEFDTKFEKELEIHKKASANAEKLIFGIFSGIAAVMLLIAFGSSASAILKINKEENAPGRVVEIIQRREYINEQDRVSQDYYYPVVNFVSSDGHRHSVQMNEGSSAPSHEVGEEVTILYNSDRHLEARIKSFGSSALMWILPGITGILGLAFLGAALVVRKLMPPTENPQNELV
ncbi:MAG TPA: DUF3592 domain-containing protein [Anaerolineales bacterium]|nr:DUF3592 domain-containing protein [Anaerolineales bacterium]